MKRIICIILSLLAVCFAVGCTPNEPTHGNVSIPLGFDGDVVYGLSKEQISSDHEVSAWLDKCATSGRDEMFGCYALKIAHISGPDAETVEHTVYVYRVNTKAGADIAVETYDDHGNHVVRINYTSNGSDGGYDIVKLNIKIPAGKKLIIEPVCDGDYPGCINTNRTVNEG